jgi:uncharacterized protein (DUF2062 family)
MKFQRQIKYYYLRLARLKDDPRELALGVALGVFAGMMPIMPFQTIMAIAMALFMKASKITAAAGTWISNPLNWYLVYFYNYKLGAFILGLPKQSIIFSSIMTAARSGTEPIVIVEKILGSGTAIIAAFLIGGIIMGVSLAIPSYFGSLYSFIFIRALKEKRRHKH